MKIAVCLSAQTRTFDYCVESILEFFNDCDFFCHTYDYNTYHEIGVDPIWDKWNPNTIDLIQDTLNPKLLSVTSREEAEKIFKSMGWDGHEGNINTYSMFYSMIESYNYDFSDYDYVVKSRYDVIHGDNGYKDIRNYIVKWPEHKKIKRFFISDYVDTSIENNDFPMNDVQWVTDIDTAKHIHQFQKKLTPGTHVDNTLLLKHLLEHQIAFKDIGQSWQIVRPRYTRIEPDWRKLIANYHVLLKEDSLIHGNSHFEGEV